MKKSRLIYLLLFLLAIHLVIVTNQAIPATRPTVIVVGFDIPISGFQYEENLPNALTDLMINALINSNRFRVFERRKLDTLVQEQNFQHVSGLVDPETAVQLGKMIGANLVITGSITGLSRGGGGGFNIGPVSLGSASTRVTLTVRIVDVTTGEILYSSVKDKKATRSKVGIQLPIIGGLGAYSQTSQDIITTVNQICEEIVTEFVSKMDEGIGTLATIPVEGYVVDMSGSTIYINLGQSTGIKVGDLVRIYRPGKTIVDPKTKKVLDQQLTLIAEARVTRVKMNLSEIMVIGKSGKNIEIRLEDVVEVVSSSDESMVLGEESLVENQTDQENQQDMMVAVETEQVASGSSPSDNLEEETSSSPELELVGEEEIEKTEEDLINSSEETLFEGKVVKTQREYHPDGSLKIEYTYYLDDNNKRIYHGTFTKWHMNGVIMIQGTYRDGKKDGVWKECLPNGVTRYEGSYVNDIKEGVWIYYYDIGNKHFEGSYHQGQKHGTWIEYINTKEEKKLSEVNYENGKEVPGTFIQWDLYGNVVKKD